MIFVTVGSQMPFDRLISAVDVWAALHPHVDVFAQTGVTRYQAKHIRTVEVLQPVDFRNHVDRCSVIVAHAGMGSVLTAMEAGKPLLILPRRGDLQETRNDHQVATAQWLEGRFGVHVAMTESELGVKLENLLTQSKTTQVLSSSASDTLIQTLCSFIGD